MRVNAGELRNAQVRAQTTVAVHTKALSMPIEELFKRLGAALAIGLLIGIERGWRTRDEAEGQRTAGLRTYTLSGLLGGIGAMLSAHTSPAVLGLAFIAYTGAFAAFSWLEAQADKNFSVTSVVAAMLTFALGAYAVLGELEVAIAAAVAATLLLALKQPLHGWLRRLSWEEIRAALILLAMSFLLLPILPDRTIDPWGALNPAEIWLLAIIIAALSFAGYIAVQVMGDKAGIALAALAGGLASSTATTLTFARLAKEQHEASALLAGGALLAGSIMFARILVVVAALNTALLPLVAWPIGAAGLVLLAGGGALVWRRIGGARDKPLLQLKSPFELGTALKLAGFIAVISLLAKIVSEKIGAAGVFIVAAVSGLADVDALTLSMSRLSPASVPVATAALAIAITAGVNTIVKAVMAATVGTARMGTIMGAISAASLVAGAAAFFLFAAVAKH
jgi:uncharacterized membrane protein (DUF4010 family)